MQRPHPFRDGITSTELLLLAVIATIVFGLLVQLLGA
jgi:hypothetical protein